LNKYYKKNAQPVTGEEEKRVLRLVDAKSIKYLKRYYRNMRAARDDEYYSWQKSFLYKRRRDSIASILKGERSSTYDAIGDAAYSEHLDELENEYDRNFNIYDVPQEEMEGVYKRIEIASDALRDARIKIAHDALRDATAALPSAPLLNEPSADEEEAV
jgi:hypothetical protein